MGGRWVIGRIFRVFGVFIFWGCLGFVLFELIVRRFNVFVYLVLSI